MLRRSPILLFLCIFVLPVQANESLFTYEQFQDGLDIRSVEAHDQSRIWTTCAVVHELVAMMDDNGPDSASAKQSANQGNGAKLASGIVFIVDYFEETDAPDPAAFVNKWEMAKLVMEENKDRAALFVILAKKTGGTPDEVAKKFAQGMASKAKKGHWFKKPSGNWVSK